MNNIGNYLLLFAFSFIFNSLLTRLLVPTLLYFGVVDVPEGRRRHDKITPRGGGLAIILVVLIAFTGFEYLATYSLSYSSKLIPILTFISAISFLDDLNHISAFIRLLVHITCAALAVFLFLYPFFLFNNELPLYANFILAVIGFTAFINIYNFMDGIDGISCIQSTHLSITMLLLCYFKSDIIVDLNVIITLIVIILACSISFLLFNWHPARIFPGDVGSIGLGFLIGLCLLFIANSSLHLLLACFIAALYYIADAGLTIFIRLVQKEKIWTPHLKHFFQKAVQQGKTQKEVVMHIIMCNIFLMILAVTSLYFPLSSFAFAISVVTLTIVKLQYESVKI